MVNRKWQIVISMYQYDFHTYSVRRKRSLKKVFVSVVLLSFLGILFWGSVNFFSQETRDDKNVVSPIGSEVTSLLGALTKNKTNELETVVQNALGDTPGTYGISIHNLKTNESYAVNDHRVFTSASLYKLWVMATVFEQIEKGTLSEDTPLHGDISSLNKKFGIASESAELTEGEVDFTVASALNQMITISHNYAAMLLTERVRLSNVKVFLETHGLRESKVGTDTDLPSTTAADTALFFEKLVKGELANKEHTQEMLTLLKAQRLNGKLPKYLPTDTVIAHKTGELYLFTHDAGIVYTPQGNYVIAILSETPNPQVAEEKIATISKAVYEYMTTR